MLSSQVLAAPEADNRLTVVGVVLAVALHAGLVGLWPLGASPLQASQLQASQLQGSQPAAAAFFIEAIDAMPAEPVETAEVKPVARTSVESVVAQKNRRQAQVERLAQTELLKPVEQLTQAESPTSVESLTSVETQVAEPSAVPVLVDKPQFVTPPVYPAYPSLAHRRGQEGTVWLEIWLSENGKQLQLSIARSSGFSSLDEAAKAAAARWQFMPYRMNGMTVASRVQVPVEFVIQ